MPMYEYRCDDCGQTIEKIKKFTESEVVEMCPKCCKPMRKTISNPLWIKADGFWYRNDYQNQGKKDFEDALNEYDGHQKNYEKTLRNEGM